MGTNHTPLNEEIAWTIRESVKARYVRLKVTPPGKVEVVVPRGFDRAQLPTILNQKRSWILRTLQRFHAIAPLPVAALPTIIELAAINEQWPVQYQATETSQRIRCQIGSGHLLLLGKPLMQSECKKMLDRWAWDKAKLHLPAMLHQVSRETKLNFRKITVRRQKTLWGSCTSRKDISLNYKLLFLPQRIARYVLIHELCHTVHLNHSLRFWRLVETHEADYRQIERELRDAWRYVPSWAET